MKSIVTLSIVLVAAMTSANAVHSAEADAVTGPYAGIGLGISGFEFDGDVTPGVASDLRSQALKLYGGYQITSFLGAEIGYVRTGQVSETRIVDGQNITQTANTRAVYAAVTGRVPVTERFMVTGRLGMSYGDVNGHEAISGNASVFGRESSVMGGFGAQYRVNEKMAVALDVDNIGQESDRVSAGMLTLTVRRTF